MDLRVTDNSFFIGLLSRNIWDNTTMTLKLADVFPNTSSSLRPSPDSRTHPHDKMNRFLETFPDLAASFNLVLEHPKKADMLIKLNKGKVTITLPDGDGDFSLEVPLTYDHFKVYRKMKN